MEPVSENRELFIQVAASLKQIAANLNFGTSLREEIHAITRELNALRQENRQMDERYLNRFQRLEQTLEKYGMENSDRKHSQTQDRQQKAKKPGAKFLNNPLTVHFPPDRYFGIKDSRNTTLNFQQLIETIKHYVVKPKKVLFSWQASREVWTLLATIKAPGVDKKKRIIWVAKPTVTHQNNVVTEIIRLNIEEKELSREEMLKFFKLLKNNVTQWRKPA